MKDLSLSRPLRITDRRAAAAFSDPLRRRLVLLCAARPRSAAQMAALLGEDLKRLHYHVTVLQELGLLAVAHVQRRGGRPIKFYRAAADAFFVPEALAPVAPSRALEDELRSALDRLKEDTLYYLGEDAQPQMRKVQSPSGNGHAVEAWRVLRLSPADAARLAQQVDHVVKSFRARDSGATKDYLMHFAFAPRAAGRRRAAKPRRP